MKKKIFYIIILALISFFPLSIMETVHAEDQWTPQKTCSSPEYRKPAKYIGTVVNFIRIIVPIVIILLGVKDLYSGMTANKDEGMKKAVRTIVIRVGAGLAIFLIPGLIQFILNMVNEWSDYKNNWCCCTECILNSDCDTNSCSSDSCHIEGTN